VKYGLISNSPILRNFSKYFPIYTEIQHGWYPDPTMHFNHHLNNNNYRFALLWNYENYYHLKIPSWKKAIIGCPYVYYRRKNNLHHKNNAIGTVFYPQHGTIKHSIEIDFKLVVNELKELPKSFHPITVSLYIDDYLDKSINNLYASEFSVVTAGNPFSPEFVKNFYKILLRHKYAIGNDVTTASFLAVEAGIPFSLLKNKNIKIINKKTGKQIPYSSHIRNNKLCNNYKIFGQNPNINISFALKKEVKKHLGIGQESHILRIYCVLVLSLLASYFKILSLRYRKNVLKSHD
jgi:hypothetical protein